MSGENLKRISNTMRADLLDGLRKHARKSGVSFRFALEDAVKHYLDFLDASQGEARTESSGPPEQAHAQSSKLLKRLSKNQ